MPLLDVRDLRVRFHTRHGVVRAVDGITYTIEPGETLGIVGESGCGKSVSQYALLGLIPAPPGRIESGSALFDGVDLLRCPPAQLRGIRGRRISMIFQDPMTALNPYLAVGRQIMEPLLIHERCSRKAAWRRTIEALESVGIQDAERRMRMHPHAFSGGMRQRVMIAMALVTKPALLIADEPTTALDVTVQAQILSLIKELQRSHGMAMVLITHDMGIVAGTCQRVLVMYAGRIVEEAAVRPLFHDSKHPYTRALMASLPAVHAHGTPLCAIPGLPPDLIQPIEGCPFAPRCTDMAARCSLKDPVLRRVQDDHATACLLQQEPVA